MSRAANYQSKTNRYINPVHNTVKKTIEFLTIESELPFGKYKGKPLKDVMEIDFKYVLWAQKNNVFMLSFTTSKMIKDKYEITKKVYTKEEEETFFSKINEKREANKASKIVKEKVAPVTTVYLFDETKTFVRCYDSQEDCATELQLAPSTISNAIRSKNIVKDKYYFSKSEYGFMMF